VPTVRLEIVAKPGGGERVLSHLDARTLRAFDDVVSRAVPAIERALGPEVIANRAMIGPMGSTFRLEAFGPARRRWTNAVRRALLRPDVRAAALIDVRDCYASIGFEAVWRALGSVGIPASQLRTVDLLLRQIRDAGVRGLPVGPEPSAVLANAVLAEVDSVARSQGVSHVRWVDDFVVVGSDLGRVSLAVGAMLRSLERLGLEHNDRKTRVLDCLDEVSTELLGAGRTSCAKPRRAWDDSPS
jgi:hypothetical protein